MTTRTLLFTDVVDSTSLVEQLGDVRAAEVWSAHDRRARDLIAQHRGREIDRTDGFFLLFDVPADAVRFALDYHLALKELKLAARVGVHVGEITERVNSANDVSRGAKPVEVEGVAKPFAARLMALAHAGQTLLSERAFRAVDVVPANADLQSHGYYRLKGIETPVEVLEVGRRGQCDFVPPLDVDKAYRVVRVSDLWVPLREVRHNLPAERDGFVGRGAELHDLARRIDDGARLVTVLGPGGTGKTRFVTRYGRVWLGDWPGGVCLCDLSEARSLDGLLFAVAAAFEVQLGKNDVALQLGHVIAARGRCLVVLDNFEQLVAHAAATVGAWLDRAGSATFVVTSREALHLAGESRLVLDPLPLEHEAVELFVMRAAAQRPGFELTDVNAAAVREVVRLLDGLPLAIELAAARVRVLSPAQLVERMRDRFALLSGARGASARQATLRAVIDWSWELLAPWEQAALAQCSVFDGGFTLEAAEGVLDMAPWPDAPPVLDVMQALLDKSLLHARFARYDLGEPYFAMYLSILEYAADRLEREGPGATRAAQQRHGAYYARHGSDAQVDALYAHDAVSRQRELALEIDNLSAACRRAAERGDGAVAVANYRAAWEVLNRRGPFATGATLGGLVLAMEGLGPADRARAGLCRAVALRLLGRVLEANATLVEAIGLARTAEQVRTEGAALGQLGLLQLGQGRIDEARVSLERALELCRSIGARRDEGTALGNLGGLCASQGQLDAALGHHEAASAIFRLIGDRRSEGAVLSSLANLYQDEGRMAEARASHEASIEIHREVGNRLSEGIAMGNLATLHNDQGRLDEAGLAYEAALVIHREIGDRLGEAVTLGNLGKLAADLDRPADARWHYDEALAIAREIGSPREEGIVLGQLGILHQKAGRLDLARESYQKALDIARAIGNRRFEGEALTNLADLLFEQGRMEEAREALNGAEAVFREINDAFDLGKMLCIRAQVELAVGDHDSARAAFAEASTLAEAMGVGPDGDFGRLLAMVGVSLRPSSDAPAAD